MEPDLDELFKNIEKLCARIGWKAAKKLLPDKRQFRNDTEKSIYNMIQDYRKKHRSKK